MYRSQRVLELSEDLVLHLAPRKLRVFVEQMDRLVSGQMPEDEAVAMVKAFAPLAEINLTAESRSFWSAVTKTGRRLTRIRNITGRLRGLWGVTPILTTTYCAESDRILGMDSSSIVFTNYYITSRFHLNFNSTTKKMSEIGHEMVYAFRRLVMTWVLIRYDVFWYYHDTGIMLPNGGYGSDFGINLQEMQLLKNAKKFLLVYAYGADYRTRKKTIASAPLNFCMDCTDIGRYCICDDVGGEQMLQTIGSYATRAVAFGLEVEQIPNYRFLNYLLLDAEELAEARRQITLKRNQSNIYAPLRIGHFPNHGFFKGTSYLKDAVEKLQAEGIPVELNYFTGLPRSEVLKAMLGVDVLVDQLVSGAYGLTAVEAMGLGLPVIVYMRDGIEISQSKDCPVINANAHNIEGVLRRIIKEPSELQAAAKKGPEFVGRHHSIQSFSARLGQMYLDELPLSWLSRRHIRRGIAAADKQTEAVALELSQAALGPDSRR